MTGLGFVAICLTSLAIAALIATTPCYFCQRRYIHRRDCFQRRARKLWRK